jgi:hypothetical protein
MRSLEWFVNSVRDDSLAFMERLGSLFLLLRWRTYLNNSWRVKRTVELQCQRDDHENQVNGDLMLILQIRIMTDG